MLNSLVYYFIMALYVVLVIWFIPNLYYRIRLFYINLNNKKTSLDNNKFLDRWFISKAKERHDLEFDDSGNQ